MWNLFSVFLVTVVIVVARLPDSEAQTQNLNATSLLSWIPPKDWHSKFPYYISGFDMEGHPIILVEYGKWNFVPLMREGAETAKMMENYIEQAMQSVIHLGNSFEESEGGLFIADFQGLDYSQLAHIPTALMLLRMARYNPKLEKAMYKGIALNMNYATEVLFGMVGPIVGSSLAKTELYGTNKERWIAMLGSIIPGSQLPPWYGGSQKWKPIQVLGKGEPMDLDLIRREQLKFLQDGSK